MKREEYLDRLRMTLERDGFEQVEEAVAWFDEMLQDRMADSGTGEDETVAAMEPPEAVAGALREGAAKARDRAEAPRQDAAEGGAAQEADGFTGVKVVRFKADQARHIRVRDRNTSVTVTGVAGDEIVLRHPQSRKDRYDFTLENGTMTLVRQPWDFSQGIFSFGPFNRDMYRVTLEVPRELAAELDVSTTNSSVRRDGFSCWGRARAASTNGSLTLTDVHAKSLDLKTGNGRVTLERVKAQDALAAVTSNGRAEAQDTQAGGPLTLMTSNSSIRAKGVRAPSVSLVTSNGSIEAERVDAPDVTMTTANASIRGTLPGSVADWDVTSATSNGKNSLPSRKQGGAKRLNVRTSNGSIKLSFEKDGAGA
ncbi:MAG TPA: DUF4097 family beta strand repeat-containing protein [Candidatus Limnocylindria bacterium]|nr:DUF4097 family beta strand repeat-containing protein [Candidatus Limnocylindria bacterium]